ncbi:MAG: dethiobiotin synthase [Gammaproteobacteria bacterium]
MSRGWFITGSDTGCGKTRVACALLHACRQQGLRTLAMKPVASGCEHQGERLVNDDALALMAATDVPLSYEAVNPYALSLPVSPHLAAAEMGVTIDIAALAAHYAALRRQADVAVVEGVGGWRAPLTEQHTVADLALGLELPVILVVGIGLGCLNHALLSAEAIARDGARLAGWVANRRDPACLMADRIIATLAEKIPAPLLGVMPYAKKMDARASAAHLDIHPLLVD